MSRAFLEILVTLSTTTPAIKDNAIEEFEHGLVVVWGTDIKDPIDFTPRSRCAKGGVMKFLQSYPLEHLKVISAAKDSATSSLKIFVIKDIMFLCYFICILTPIQKSF